MGRARRPRAAERWKRAMNKSIKAVPDIADLVQAAFEATSDAHSELPMMPRRVRKAVLSANMLGTV